MRGVACLLFLAPSLVAQGLALTGVRIHVGDGTVIERGTLLLRGGTVEAVQRGQAAPRGYRVFHLPGREVTPAFVDVHAHVGGEADLAEPIGPLWPDLLAADGFDPFHPSLAGAPQSGVAAIGVAPGPGAVLAGRMCVAEVGPEGARLLVEEGPFAASLSRRALRREGPPTSRPWAVHLLREALAGPALAPVRAGRVPLFVDVERVPEAEAAVALTEGTRIRLVLVHGSELLPAAERLGRQGVVLAVGPLRPGQPLRVYRVAAAVARAGGEVVFASDAPAAPLGDLRLTAALAVGHGLPAGVALEGLTLRAARLLGIADRLGSLEPGKAAHVLVWDGPPLCLTSRLEGILLGGRWVREPSVGGEP